MVYEFMLQSSLETLAVLSEIFNPVGNPIVIFHDRPRLVRVHWHSEKQTGRFL